MSTLFVNTISPNSGDTVTISGSLNTTGKFTVGDAITDSIIFNAEVSSSIVPDAGNTYDLGDSNGIKTWRNLYVSNTGSISNLSASHVTSDLLSTVGVSNHLNPETGSSFSLGTMAQPWASLHVHGVGHIHTASLNLVSSSLLPNADNSHDIGGAGREWKDLYIDGTAFIDRIESPIIDSPSIIGTGSIVASILQVTSSGAHASFTTASFNKISSSLVPSSGSHFDLGLVNEEWRNVFTAEVSASKILANILTASNSDITILNSQQITVVSASTSYLNLGTDGTKISGSMIPSEPNIGDLGTMAMAWRNLHAHGLAHIHTASINVVSSSLIPDASLVHDLGSPTKYWRDLYVSSGSIKFVSESGLITDLSQANVKDLKEGRPVAEIGGFSKSTRTKAVFQDDDTTTYKKMTVKGRVSQFISGVLVKDYNKSGSNSYSKKYGIQTYEWNGADSMSFNSTHSFWNVENMSMDITEGGFFGLAISGSTAASNNHNMANNLSGLFFTGSEVIVSGSNISLSGSITASGTSLLEGGTTTINGTFGNITSSLSGSDQALIVSGTLEVDGAIGVNYSNNVQVTSSLTLTNVDHGMGRQVLVRSGSNPVSTTPGFNFNLPIQSGVYKSTSPAGTITLTLPAATIGLSFNVYHSCFHGGFDGLYPPSLKLTPSGTNRFIYGAGGSAGVMDKAIISPSSSVDGGDFVVVSCVSESSWMIQQMGGTWVDEA